MWRTIRSLIGGAVGRVAQRESTAFDTAGVTGSIPVAPTIFPFNINALYTCSALGDAHFFG